MIADEKMQESSSEPPSSPFHHPQGKSFEYCYYFSYLVISLITKISIDTLGPRYWQSHKEIYVTKRSHYVKKQNYDSVDKNRYKKKILLYELSYVFTVQRDGGPRTANWIS